MSTAVMMPTQVNSTSDPYLEARVSNARRLDRTRRAPPSPSHTLDAVPEDGHSVIKRAPPTSFKPIGEDAVWVNRKGESRAGSLKPPGGKRRADWALDLSTTAKGAESWADKERVILVLGFPTAEDLAPVLYNPAFANTLLLVGTSRSVPSIAALNSPSQLLRQDGDGREIYPTFQPFDLEGSASAPHSLPAIIAHASSLVKRYRRASSGRSISRSNSSESLGYRTSLRNGSAGNLLSPDSTSRSSDESNPRSRPPSLMDFHTSSSESNFLSMRRLSSTFSRDSRYSLRGGKDSVPVNNSGILFDAVVNFVPPVTEFAADRAMQDMLHQAVVVTSGLMPELTRPTGKSGVVDTLAIPLIHVLPPQVPGPLPGVIESFLLGVVPKFGTLGDRRIWSGLVTRPVWSATPHQTGGVTYSGAEILLYGGVRSEVSKADPDVHARGFLPNWAATVPKSSSGPAPIRPRTSPSPLRLEPGSNGYVNRSPRPSTLSRRLDQPATPELEPSTSTCSSNSALGELGSAATSEDGPLPTTPLEKPRKGFTTWFRSKSKKRS